MRCFQISYAYPEARKQELIGLPVTVIMRAEVRIMVNFTSEQISEHIFKITAPGVYCWLVMGKEKACLIDTAWGAGDLKAFVDSICPLPYFVIISHCHVDHVSGAAQFDRVYMNHGDLFLYEGESALSKRKQDLALFQKSFPEIADITDEDFVPVRTEPFLDLRDGDVFDLGGVHLEAVHVKGHTPGMMMILIREERVMFYGDGCTKHTFLFTNGALPVREYLEGLKHLKEYDGCYDTVIRSHNLHTQPKYILDENMELCERILKGQDARQLCTAAGHRVYAAAAVDEKLNRTDGKTANIFYPAD